MWAGMPSLPPCRPACYTVTTLPCCLHMICLRRSLCHRLLSPSLMMQLLALAHAKAPAFWHGRVAGFADRTTVLAMQDCSFDIVTCMYGLFMMPVYGEALREAARVLRPGGLLAFCVWGPDEKCQLPQASPSCGHVQPGLAMIDRYTDVEALIPMPCSHVKA